MAADDATVRGGTIALTAAQHDISRRGAVDVAGRADFCRHRMTSVAGDDAADAIRDRSVEVPGVSAHRGTIHGELQATRRRTERPFAMAGIASQCREIDLAVDVYAVAVA